LLILNQIILSYESHKYYNGNLYASIIKYVKIQQLFMDLYVGIIWMLKKSITKHICKYYNGCKKKNEELFTRPICEYCNGYKKKTIIYETYM